ncbi:hypothetical protein [Alienimonas californiensis]|uniref:Antitoxin n=1 Tax=Alienimonas californiensis TaxID=2527989 RepID=A0A517P4D5_9PLAN|nr:hypothetical protein [Alienimonas californiensis]QDT14244.1 hypothetical protein CA12_03150 [Alienimonas californiensis]
MTTLTIDESTYAGLSKLADARGLSVEKWLAEEVAKAIPAEKPDPEGWDEWIESFIAAHPRAAGPVDDSRESIYP